MGVSRRVRVALRGAASLLLTLVLAAQPLAVAPASALTGAPTPVVDGNRLVDSRTGQTWTAHAVNWPSFEYACQQGWAYSSGGANAQAAAAMAAWHITAVRIPLNEACWLGIEGSPGFGTVAGYQAALRSWVDTLNAAGIVAILDLHWSSPPGYPANGQRAMADARSLTFWQQVAAAYATSKSVLFDAFNEPYSRYDDATGSWAFQLSWTCWRDGGCNAPVENDQTSPLTGATYPLVGMASIVSTIRGAGATQPILLGGLDYSNDLRGWLANRPSDPQLVASWHNYPGQRCQTESCWNAEILPVAAVVPVIASEFGQSDGGTGHLTTFMPWADAHGIGYAPWAWWVVNGGGSGYYALITDLTNFTPKAPSGTVFHDHLAALWALGPFADVPPAHPFFGDIRWMWDTGLTTGNLNGSARPNYLPLDDVSRQSMAAFLYRLERTAFTPPTTASFVDVPVGHPFFAAIEWMRSAGLTNGYNDPEGLAFHPGEAVSRQAMAAFLHRLAPGGTAPTTATFTDVPVGSPFFADIEWMRSEAITNGYADPGGLAFHPLESVSRQAMAAFLHRFVD